MKTIRGDLVINHTLLERFQREAEAVAKLRHPNIVPIFSVGESREIAYFTMPLIEGESLAAVLEREGRLPAAETARILREAAQGLHAAHQAGIVHRDIKPDNIMLEGVERTVVVMDFGIAKTGGSDASGLTGSGLLVGTPHYMSPEQAMGEKALGAASDQYALATVGYRMLTGRTPFVATSLQNLLFKTVTEVPAPAREVSGDVPTEISDALAKALSKQPESRYASIAEFGAAFAPFENPAGDGHMTNGRVGESIGTRSTAMRQYEPQFWNWMVGAVPFAAATIALLVVATPSIPIALAGSRDEAVSVARAFMNNRGVQQRGVETSRFVTRDTAFRFLHEEIGQSGIESRPVSATPVWEWKVTRASGWGTTDPDVWEIFVTRDNRVSGFRNPIPDDAVGKQIPVDSARTLALAELQQQGWSLTGLESLADSSINREVGSEHLFRWRQRQATARSPADRPSVDQLHVRIAGHRVVSFRQEMGIPARAIKGNPEWVLALLLLGIVFTLAISVIVTLRHSSGDVLQWTRMLPLAAVIWFGLLIGQGHEIYDIVTTMGATRESAFVSISMTAAFLLFGAIAIWCVAVASESLAYRARREMTAGLTDLSKGQLIIPEMVAAAGRGYVFGGLMALLVALRIFLTLRLGIGAPLLPQLPFSTPLRDLLLVVPLEAVLRTFLWLYVAAVFANGTRTRKLLVAAAVAVPMVARSRGFDPVASVFLLVGVGILVYVLWRHGFLTAVVAIIVASTVHFSAALFRVADSGYLPGAAACILVLATPGVLAMFSMRRYRSTALPELSKTTGLNV